MCRCQSPDPIHLLQRFSDENASLVTPPLLYNFGVAYVLVLFVIRYILWRAGQNGYTPQVLINNLYLDTQASGAPPPKRRTTPKVIHPHIFLTHGSLP